MIDPYGIGVIRDGSQIKAGMFVWCRKNAGWAKVVTAESEGLAGPGYPFHPEDLLIEDGGSITKSASYIVCPVRITYHYPDGSIRQVFDPMK